MWFQKPPLGTPLDWGNPLNKGTAMALAMNEGHGDKVQDLSLNRNHGTLNNFAFPPTVASGWNPGRTGIGLNFDGTGDYIDCNNNPTLGLIDAVTISSYINLDTIQACVIAGKLNMYRFGVHGDGKLRPILTLGGVPQTADYSDTVLSTNTWYHVVMTYDKNGGANNENIYINGELEKSWTKAGSIGVTATDLIVGAVSGANFFDGSIDQPRIQSRAWSAKEVRDYSINPWQVYLDE